MKLPEKGREDEDEYKQNAAHRNDRHRIHLGSAYEVLCQNENAVIYAICDLNEQRATAAAQKYDAQSVYTDYREMLKDPHVDAVSICTWNNTHAEFAIAALEAGKHVLLEKPVATNVEDALRIEEAVKKRLYLHRWICAALRQQYADAAEIY